MPRKSAGILLYKIENKNLKIFLAHPGGPFWAKKDDGAWSIPKGEFDDHEDPLNAAKREFKEETGVMLSGEFLALDPIKQKSGKIVYAWAVEGDIDVSKIKSNEFEIEWPPKSGKMKLFPEIDKAAWFDLDEAGRKIIEAQSSLVRQLRNMLKNDQ
jgi:predicted NUDIX family NTP pyrophosphohydrolase